MTSNGCLPANALLEPAHCKHVAPIIQTGLFAFWMVWVRQSIRRCYRERTNDVRYGVITVQYFSLRPDLRFVIFPDWLQNSFVDPQPTFSLAWPFAPCTANGSMHFTPMSRPSNSVCKSLRDKALLARRTRFLSKFNTSKRPSKSTTLLLPNLIIVLIIAIIGPWIGPALAPFLSFLAVAVHISMSQTNHRYTSHGRGDSAVAQKNFPPSAI